MKLKHLDEETFAFLLARHDKRAYRELDNALKAYISPDILFTFKLQRLLLDQACKRYREAVEQGIDQYEKRMSGNDQIDRELAAAGAVDEQIRSELREKGPSVESCLAEAGSPKEIVFYEKIRNRDEAEVIVFPHDNPDKETRLSHTHLSYIKEFPSGRVESYQVPLHMLIKPWSAKYRKKGTYQVYRHSFFRNRDAGEADSYIGITKQRWQVRWSQHIQSAKSGSPYLMHEALRNAEEYNLMEHEVYAAGLTYEDAMNVEEFFVEKLSLYPHGLNMIPGGFAGLRYLAMMNALRPRETGEFKDRVISDLMTGRRKDETGKSNSLIAEHWHNPKYAESVICGHSGRFSADEVRTIRVLAACEWGAEKIAHHLGIANALPRIKMLTKGKTYNRIV
jgi:hypothetical protein